MEEQQKKLSRRDALKILGTTAGASVLATLPSEWSKPALAAGKLPEHAQQSEPMATEEPIERSPLTFIDGTTNTTGCSYQQFWIKVQISEQIAGVQLSLKIQYQGTGPPATLTPNPEGIYQTDGLGVASPNHFMIDFSSSAFAQILIFTWSFVNSADGSDTYVHELSCFPSPP